MCAPPGKWHIGRSLSGNTSWDNPFAPPASNLCFKYMCMVYSWEGAECWRVVEPGTSSTYGFSCGLNDGPQSGYHIIYIGFEMADVPQEIHWPSTYSRVGRQLRPPNSCRLHISQPTNCSYSHGMFAIRSSFDLNALVPFCATHYQACSGGHATRKVFHACTSLKNPGLSTHDAS